MAHVVTKVIICFILTIPRAVKINAVFNTENTVCIIKKLNYNVFSDIYSVNVIVCLRK